jgi:hypothetical protein
MRQLFTGEKIFFGDRPRNAHHWMVISDELFDHREALMASVLRQHGLAAHLIERWQAIENSFRSDIVKTKPWVKVMAGVEDFQCSRTHRMHFHCPAKPIPFLT